MTLIITSIRSVDDAGLSIDEAADVAMAPQAIADVLKQLDPEDLYDLIGALQLFWLQNYENVGKGVPASSPQHEVYRVTCPVGFCAAEPGKRCKSRRGTTIVWPHIARYQVVSPNETSGQMREHGHKGAKGPHVPRGTDGGT